MVKIKYGAYFSEIKGLEQKHIDALRYYLRIEIDYDKRLQEAKYSGSLPERYDYFMLSNGEFASGLIERVKSYLDHHSIAYKIDYPNVDKLDTFKVKKLVDRMANLEYPIHLRQYQKRAIYAACKNPMGIFYLATGLGKSVILAVIAEALDRNVLVLCQSTDLAKQLQEEIEFYTGNEDIGFIGNGKFKPKRVTVGILQSFNLGRKQKKSRQQFIEYMNSVEAVIVDECHNAQSISYANVLDKLPNALIRYGMSATPFTSLIRSEDGEKIGFDLAIHAFFGEYIYKMNTSDGVEQGYLARPIIEMPGFDLEMNSDIVDYHYEYSKYLVNNDKRNDYIASLANDAFIKNERVVIFVTRIEHGNKIVEALVNNHDINPSQIALVTGQVPKDERKALLFGFKTFERNIVIGTVLKEGLNFACDVGINAGGGTSRRAAIQSLGRILRKTRDPETNDVLLDKEEIVRFVDIFDFNHPFFVSASRKRMEIYKAEKHVIKKETK